ncbi:MAG: AsmA family protein [Lentisphaeraceae bacterium]|nr:AsmA family protein [Lentisphaeraceae bacterium]
MKKAVKIVGVLFGLLVIGLIVGYFFLGSIVSKGVETVGPDLTKGDVKLESASLSIFGSGGIKGLEIGNPKNGDFPSPFAFKMGSVDVSVQIGSITSDKIVINSIEVDGAELCWEGLTGDNHQKILENIKEYAGPSDESIEEEPQEDGTQKSLEIKLFKMTNTKIHLYGFGKKLTEITLPDFQEENIGSGKGMEVNDSIAVLYKSMLGSVTSYIKKSQDMLGKSWDSLSGQGSDVIDSVKEGSKGVVDGIKNIFK